MFPVYFRLGIEHICDLNAYDHIIFILTLVAGYQIKEWKKLLILVTAFTLGHSISLLLAITGVVNFPSEIIEFLIPVTIFLTAVLNLVRTKNLLRFEYGLVTFFGLIHGLGFSNFLKVAMSAADGLFIPLLAFNLGLEAGQLLIIAVILSLILLFQFIKKVNPASLSTFLNGVCIGIAVILMHQTKFW